jgi:hypothetical protein
MKLVLAALIIWSLPFLGGSCGSANVQKPEPELAVPSFVAATLTLTNEHPSGSFPIYPDLNDPPKRVEIAVTKVVNPRAAPVTILVSLSPNYEKDSPAPPRVEVGNFSLYPVDRPGKFTFDAIPAFGKAARLKDASKVKEWFVVLELKPEPGRASSPLEVTIEQPQWKRDKP